MPLKTLYKIYDDVAAAEYIQAQVAEAVNEGRRCLILLSGGSAIAMEVNLANRFSDLQDKLCFSLADERFGPPGHSSSNWAQLEAAGFPTKNISGYPVLRGEGIDSTTEDFNKFLARSQQDFDYRIGILGLGADGHTSGILPGSPAMNANEFAASYQGPDYERITTTPKYLATLDCVFLYAIGEAKWPQLDKLELDLDINEQPAQALKQAKNLIIFSDYKGELL